MAPDRASPPLQIIAEDEQADGRTWKSPPANILVKSVATLRFLAARLKTTYWPLRDL